MFNEIKTSTILTYAALSVVVVVSSHAYKNNGLLKWPNLLFSHTNPKTPDAVHPRGSPHFKSGQRLPSPQY
jgi:hypothetical protein